VIRYDLFGRGLSDRPDAAYDGAFYDRQLDDLLKALKVDGKIDLFGLSFGGYVSAHYASTHPQRIRTLNLVDPSNSAPKLRGSSPRRCWALTCSRPAWCRAWPTTRAATSCIPNNSPAGPSAIARRCSTTALAARCIARDSACRRKTSTPSTPPSPRGTPVHLVWGKQDPVIPWRSRRTSATPFRRGIH
jgi:pimeloyl-ACP methyl ester carboxylesterase